MATRPCGVSGGAHQFSQFCLQGRTPAFYLRAQSRAANGNSSLSQPSRTLYLSLCQEVQPVVLRDPCVFSDSISSALSSVLLIMILAHKVVIFDSNK
jgi:hypothetical protein